MYSQDKKQSHPSLGPSPMFTFSPYFWYDGIITIEIFTAKERLAVSQLHSDFLQPKQSSPENNNNNVSLSLDLDVGLPGV